MHTAAGITAARHDAAPGHQAVRKFATSGTPIPPATGRTPRTATSPTSRRGAGTSRASAAKGGVPTGRAPSPRRQPRRPVRHG
jgi:hypothetical protein